MSETSGFDKTNRKALLDGMLFEIFFNAKGELRNEIKSSLFNELFELERHAEVKDSFDFISETLTAARGDFYAVPGRNQEIAVTVVTKVATDGYRVDAVFVDGADVLRPEADESDVAEGEPFYHGTNAEILAKRLAVEMVVPARCLKVTYTPEAAKASVLQFPMGRTVRKS